MSGQILFYVSHKLKSRFPHHLVVISPFSADPLCGSAQPPSPANSALGFLFHRVSKLRTESIYSLASICLLCCSVITFDT